VIEPRNIDRPEPGFWMVRRVKGGVDVPARIFRETCTAEPGNDENRMERPAFLVAEILGETVPLERVWHARGRPIDAAEYRFQIADFEHAQAWRPHDPKHAPNARVDLSALPPLYPARKTAHAR
jgi:hypothetical protein